MIMILNQNKDALFDLRGKNIIIGGNLRNMLFISDKVNIQNESPAILGIYNDEQEAREALEEICSVIIEDNSSYNTKIIIQLNEKKEREEKDEPKQEGLEENKI